ncbi:hypothetical protein A2U01_0104601, partial [Trifolium medium]|nr:hypothetical protein [Trifolium medium]
YQGLKGDPEQGENQHAVAAELLTSLSEDFSSLGEMLITKMQLPAASNHLQQQP